jgi:hypothetical protein
MAGWFGSECAVSARVLPGYGPGDGATWRVRLSAVSNAGKLIIDKPPDDSLCPTLLLGSLSGGSAQDFGESSCYGVQ